MLNIFNLHPKPEPQYIGSIKSELKELKLGDTIELFNAAYESYKILTSSDTNKESFLKDWAFLVKRWKVVNWIWHRNGFQLERVKLLRVVELVGILRVVEQVRILWVVELVEILR